MSISDASYDSIDSNSIDEHRKELTGAVGSTCYLAPECWNKGMYNGAKSDIWSCGIALYIMCMGNIAFNKSIVELEGSYRYIHSREYQKFWENNEPDSLKLDSNLKELINKIFIVNPLDRINLNNIMKCRWLENYKYSLIDIDFQIEMKNNKNKIIDNSKKRKNEFDIEENKENKIVNEASSI